MMDVFDTGYSSSKQENCKKSAAGYREEMFHRQIVFKVPVNLTIIHDKCWHIRNKSISGLNLPL